MAFYVASRLRQSERRLQALRCRAACSARCRRWLQALAGWPAGTRCSCCAEPAPGRQAGAREAPRGAGADPPACLCCPRRRAREAAGQQGQEGQEGGGRRPLERESHGGLTTGGWGAGSAAAGAPGALGSGRPPAPPAPVRERVRCCGAGRGRAARMPRRCAARGGMYVYGGLGFPMLVRIRSALPFQVSQVKFPESLRVKRCVCGRASVWLLLGMVINTQARPSVSVYRLWSRLAIFVRICIVTQLAFGSGSTSGVGVSAG
jgi:hypothetical protein